MVVASNKFCNGKWCRYRQVPAPQLSDDILEAQAEYEMSELEVLRFGSSSHT